MLKMKFAQVGAADIFNCFCLWNPMVHISESHHRVVAFHFAAISICDDPSITVSFIFAYVR